MFLLASLTALLFIYATAITIAFLVKGGEPPRAGKVRPISEEHVPFVNVKKAKLEGMQRSTKPELQKLFDAQGGSR